MKRYFIEAYVQMAKYVQMANKHMNRCSTSLANREIQIETMMKYHYIPIRVAKINNSTEEFQIIYIATSLAMRWSLTPNPCECGLC